MRIRVLRGETRRERGGALHLLPSFEPAQRVALGEPRSGVRKIGVNRALQYRERLGVSPRGLFVRRLRDESVSLLLLLLQSDVSST